VRKQLKKLGIAFFVSMTLFIGLGYVFSSWLGVAGAATEPNRYSDLQLFTKVLNLVQRYYVKPVDTKKLIYGSINGMLKVLDPHTNFLIPEVYKEFESETSGEFGGLGVEITVKDGILTVISPIEDTPAWQAGIKAGDKIVEIDGFGTKGMTLVDAAQKMRGKLGSKVKLKIFRKSFDLPKDFFVKRDIIKIRSVKYTDLGDGYTYYKVTHFIENSARDFELALAKHAKKHSSTKGMIIDLRGNPGGILSQVVKISDMFLSEGRIVSTIPRDKKGEEIIMAKPNGMTDFPLIVLINEYSASASEILAGALQDNKRALIMGKRSFGKGTVQTVVRLGDGSALKMTAARYYTPSGRSIQAEGIHPDIVLEQIAPDAFEKLQDKDLIMREQDIKGHLKGAEEKSIAKKESESFLYWWKLAKTKKESGLSPKELLLGRDFQALQAFNYLKAWSVMQTFQMEAPRAPASK